MTTVILANAVVFGCYYYGMSAALYQGLLIANTVFSGIYVIELFLRMSAVGPIVYLSNLINFLDAIVVIVSIFDVVAMDLNAPVGAGFSSIRILRLLRICQYFPGASSVLRSLAHALPKTLDVLALLIIVMIIFSCIGMQLFGAGYDSAWESGVIPYGLPQFNYQNFGSGMLSVFQVMDNENWNDVLHLHMAAFGPWSSLFFIAIIILGNYIFLNLFLLILLDTLDDRLEAEIENQGQFFLNKIAMHIRGLFHKRCPTCCEINKKAAEEESASSSSTSTAEKENETSEKSLPFESDDSHIVYTNSMFVPSARTTVQAKSGSPKEFSHEPEMLPSVDEAMNEEDEEEDDDETASESEPTPPADPVAVPAFPPSIAKLQPIVSVSTPLPPVGASTPISPSLPVSPSVPASPSLVNNRKSKWSIGTRSSIPANATAKVQFLPNKRGYIKSVVAELPRFSTSRTLQMSRKSFGPGPISASVSVTSKDTVDSRTSGNINTPKLPVETPKSPRASSDEKVAITVDNRGHVKIKKVKSQSESELIPLDDLHYLGNCIPICARSSKFRITICSIVNSGYFDLLSLAVITLACVNLILATPPIQACINTYIPGSGSQLYAACGEMGYYLYVSDYFITFFFLAELLLRVYVSGIVYGQNAYFTQGWNILDTIIVVTSLISLFEVFHDGTTLQVLRVFRALRPLRYITRFPSVQLIVTAMFNAVPRAKDVFIIIFVVVYVFASIGVLNFAGEFYYCNDPDIDFKQDCVGYFNTSLITNNLCNYQPTPELETLCNSLTLGLPFPRVWQTYPQNFDNIGIAFLTILELMTGENWPVLSTYAINAVGPDQPMKYNNNPAAAIFYVAAEILLNFWLIELMVSIVVDSYDRLRLIHDGHALLTSEQKAWVHNMKILLSIKPQVPKSIPPTKNRYLASTRQGIFNIVSHFMFERIIIVLIILNMILLATVHYGQSIQWENAYIYGNDVFSGLFLIEAILKLIAFGYSEYFRSPWNQFDFVIAVGSIIPSIFSNTIVGVIFRIFRILRVIRLLRFVPSLRRLVKTIILSIPAFINVFALLALDLFVFSVLGVNFFYGVRFGYDGYLTADANFNSFALAMLTLFRCSTGENFNGIMHDLAVQAPYCIPGVNCGVNLGWSALYFMLFYFITAFIIINLVLAIIVEAYENSVDADNQAPGAEYRLNKDVAKTFAELWAERDPQGTQLLPLDSACEVIALLPYPLGLVDDPRLEDLPLGPDGTSFQARVRIAKVIISRFTIVPVIRPADKVACVQFHALLEALVDRASGGILLGLRSAITVGTGADGSRSHRISNVTLRTELAIVAFQRLWRVRFRERQKREEERKKALAAEEPQDVLSHRRTTSREKMAQLWTMFKNWSTGTPAEDSASAKSPEPKTSTAIAPARKASSSLPSVSKRILTTRDVGVAALSYDEKLKNKDKQQTFPKQIAHLV
jgi:Ion transport protein